MSEGMFERLTGGSGLSAVDVAVMMTTTLMCIFSLLLSHCQPCPDSLGTLHRLPVDSAGCLTYPHDCGCCFVFEETEGVGVERSLGT